MPGLQSGIGAHHSDGACVNALARTLSDNRFGLFSRVTSERLASPLPRWWISNAVLARAPLGTPFAVEHAASAGTSIDLTEATGRALGEGAERYSAMNAQVPLRVSPATALQVEPPRCEPSEPGAGLLQAAQDAGSVTVAEMTNAADESTVLVPATMVCLNFMPTAPERPVTLPISTGLAFASTITDAVWRGLCEVAERDAIMRLWWCRKPAPRIVTDSSRRLPTALLLRLRELRRAGCVVNLFALTDDFPAPGCFCVLESPIYPQLSCGAAVKDDLGAACTKAIDEAVALLAIAPHWQQQGKPAPLIAAEVTTLEDHALFYATGEHRRAFNFLFDRSPSIGFDELVAERGSATTPTSWEQLKALVQRLHSKFGWDVLWADLTADEVRGNGHVVKVVVPQMVPLSPDHNIAYLATSRLATSRPVDGFNSAPHPFA